MTKVTLLDALRDFTQEVTKDLLLPVAQQKGDAEEPAPRAAEVYRARLPDSRAAKKKAPYVLHQILTGKDAENREKGITWVTATVRSIFCVYHHDEQEGGLALLNLMERFHIALLEQRKVGNQFLLLVDEGIETLVYPDDTAPYYAGEMITTWWLPPMERKVNYGKEGYSNIRGPGPGPGCDRAGPGHGRYYGG